MIEDLISFQFPTTADYNQHNIDLKHYERYFKDQLHLAPSTDRRSIRIMNQMTLVSGNTAENDKMYHDSELGCAGFYGINNDPEVFLGMLLTTSCFEVLCWVGAARAGEPGRASAHPRGGGQEGAPPRASQPQNPALIPLSLMPFS